METERRMGLFGATGVGVGAIVGGGILVLAGVAFATTGPAAMMAFGLNGVIALLTALSFSEMASKFPESGGVYTFSKKVLSVEAAFGVGWVVWFASVVAAVLYAIGFAYFAIVLISDLWVVVAGDIPDWLGTDATIKWLAVGTIVGLGLLLMRKASGGGQWINVAKVLLFGLLIVGGFVSLAGQPASETAGTLRPFFAEGLVGLVQAMGYTFIALQGFDLIAAVGGEVREPARNLPRAMVLSLLIAIGIYLPLLFVVTAVGTPQGQTISEVAAEDPEGIVAVAAQNFLGPFGYWLVNVAAVLSMLSALQANLFAASRIARAMARDRTLPSLFARLSQRRRTPVAALCVTCALACAILLVLPDTAAAGAAASLIFLITFALAHWIAILVRQRSVRNPPPFLVPFFPLVPILGGLACVALALFQGVVVPSAGRITLVWLALGVLLFLALFARRARMTDASRTARDPELLALRGHRPLVLVPIANPQSAQAMIALADALVPAEVGRVLTQTVVVTRSDEQPDDRAEPLENAQHVLRELARVSAESGIRIEMLTTISAEPMAEIARVARLHQCETVVLGLSEISDQVQGSHLEQLLSELDSNVVIIRSRPDWALADARRVLVPVAGRGGHEHLLVLLIGSLLRTAQRDVTFLRVLPSAVTDEQVRQVSRELNQLVDNAGCEGCRIEVVRSDATVTTVAQFARQSDLVVLGVQRLGRRRKLFGTFTRKIARQTTCPIIVMSRRG